MLTMPLAKMLPCIHVSQVPQNVAIVSELIQGWQRPRMDRSPTKPNSIKIYILGYLVLSQFDHVGSVHSRR